MQTVLWTVLPNGAGEGAHGSVHHRFSVHVSPRLTGPGVLMLADFAAFVNWPETLSHASFALQVGPGGPVHEARVLPVAAVGFDPWAALLPPATRVISHAYSPLWTSKIRSFPSAAIQGFVKDRYTKLATDFPDDFPTREDLVGPNGAIGLDPLAELEVDPILQRLEDLLETERALTNPVTLPGLPVVPGPAVDFLQAVRFYNRPPLQEVDGAVIPRVPAPNLDVHQLLALTSHHPGLMRLLRVVLDLELDPPVEDVSSPTRDPDTEVRLVVRWSGIDDIVDIRPRTACTITEEVFRARSLTGATELEDGYLRLDDSARFVPLEVDVDSAALKAVHAAADVSRSLSLLTRPPTAPAPNLRSGAIAVAKVNRAAHLHEVTLGAVAANVGSLVTGPDGTDVLLGEDDLVRGYRYDLWDSDSGRWHSIVAREQSFEFVGPGGGTVALQGEEGYVTTTPTKAGAGQDDDLYLQETFVSWDGWSLVAPKPGNVMSTDDVVTAPTNDPIPETAPLRITSTVPPGTLPLARYGRSYRLLGRAVDLAGNSPPPPEPDGPEELPHVSPRLPNLRFEPIAAPVVLLGTPPAPGESAGRLVIRSNFDTPADGRSVRHLLPDKVGVSVAERHGRLDSANGAPDPGVYPVIVPREAVTFDKVPHEPAGAAPESAWWFPVENLPVPYLPDPIARGAALMGLPGPVTTTTVTFEPAAGAAWPDYRGFRLVLDEAGGGQPAWTLSDRTLVVRLPKADAVTLRVSTHPGEDDLASLGIWRWLVQAGAARQLQQKILDGLHWMISPYRTLTLVHAVRQPLLTPELVHLDVARERGDTFAGLTVEQGQFSAKSTGRLEIVGTWTEPFDDGPGAPDPGERPVTAVARVVPLDGDHVPGGDIFVLNPAIDRHELGDTKHRDITYSAVATTSFTEHYTERQTVEFGLPPGGDTAKVQLDPHGTEPGVVPGSVRITVPSADPLVRPATYVEDDGFTVDADAATVTVVAEGSPLPFGMPVDVSFVARSITRTSAQPLPVTVPATERPDAPRVVSVLPTFVWNDPTPDPAETISTRTGGGVRVYLERPWFSSGAGERLAVVLWPESGPLAEIPDDMQALVTQWADDPLWRTGGHPVKAFPEPADFPLRVDVDGDLSLDERPGRAVAAAVHEVAYEPERGLWRCDIALDTVPPGRDAAQSYWPFVRFALARYQADALPQRIAGGVTLPDLKLSPVILVDFVQIAPDRAVSITPAPPARGRNPKRARQVTVTGVVFSEGSEPLRPKGRNRMTASIEKSSEAIGGELGWVKHGEPIGFAVSVTDDGLATWSVVVTTNQDIVPGRFRLVLEETERQPTSGQPPSDNDLILGRRLVHQDIIPLA